VFESLLGEDDVLLLAHHAGDQTESLLLHLFQGRGLYGMPDARDLGSGRLMRPLLNLPRQTLSGYARAHQLEWIEDPSNSDLNLDRNFLRRRLLPMLLERFDGLPRRLARVAHAVADMGTALDELAGLDRHPLPLEVFDGLSQPARIALLRRWLAGKDAAAGVTHRALVEFLRQLDAANDRYPSLGLASGDLVRYRRALYLVPPPPELDPSYPVSIPGRLDLPHCVVEFRVQPAVAEPGGSVTASAYDESVGTTMLVPPVVVTFATALEPGAEVYHRGHRRSIRTLMREAGVAPWLRDRLPVIADRVGIALIPGVWRREPDAALDSQPRSGGDRPALTQVRYRAGGPIMRWGMR
jgi:tRNA(Ile)-lysidine synthase